MSLLKINILRHLVCDVTFSPFPRPPRGWGGLKDRTPCTILPLPVCDVTSGAIMTSLPVGKNASNLHEFTTMTSLPVCDVTEWNWGNGISLLPIMTDTAIYLCALTYSQNLYGLFP